MHIFAETSATASLDEVDAWLLGYRSNQMRLDADDLPALGQRVRLRLAIPVTARRAILCAVSLFDDVAGVILLSGQLRFVAHPTGPHINVGFSGNTTRAMSSVLLRRRAQRAVTELVEVIAESLSRSAGLTDRRQVAI
jgi:hypothetical protein